MIVVKARQLHELISLFKVAHADSALQLVLVFGTAVLELFGVEFESWQGIQKATVVDFWAMVVFETLLLDLLD